VTAYYCLLGWRQHYPLVDALRHRRAASNLRACEQTALLAIVLVDTVGPI
jgi:hypothetical protein